MQSVPCDIFLSCSFHDEDREVVEFIRNICEGIGCRCQRVDTGSSRVLAEEAKRVLGGCQGLIAVATRRDRRGDDSYTMPPAVRDEIAFAVGLSRPVLVLLEDKVDFAGMLETHTPLRWSRSTLKDADCVRRLIAAIHQFKLDILPAHRICVDTTPREFSTDVLAHRVELKRVDGQMTWEYRSTRRLSFLQDFPHPVPTACWCSVPSKHAADAPLIRVRCAIAESNVPRQLKLTTCVERPDNFEGQLTFDPPPKAGDFIEYTEVTSSPLLNPLYHDDIVEPAGLVIDGRRFDCIDGYVIITRTKRLCLEFRFPSEYGLKPNDVRPFVGTHSTRIDYLVESELKRMGANVRSFGGELSVRLEIEDPIPHHYYGLAWNPPPRP